MLRKTRCFAQLPGKVWQSGLAYSSAFGYLNERPVSEMDMASSIYSSASGKISTKRKWGRTREYQKKMRVLNSMTRQSMGWGNGGVVP